MPSPTPKPKDLPNMTIVEVTEVRPNTRALGASGSGRIVSHGSDRSIGRFGKNQDRPGRSQPVQRQASFTGGTKKDRQRRGGRGGQAPPPPPLYDGPIEPLTVSENRWVAKKDKSVRASTISSVKGLLNKLTREKFAKIMNELCAVEMTNLELLGYGSFCEWLSAYDSSIHLLCLSTLQECRISYHGQSVRRAKLCRCLCRPVQRIPRTNIQQAVVVYPSYGEHDGAWGKMQHWIRELIWWDLIYPLWSAFLSSRFIGLQFVNPIISR